MPLLLTCYKAFFATQRRLFTDILEAVVILTFRSSIICNMPVNEQERLYNKIALHVYSGEYTNKSQILHALQALSVDDTTFQAKMAGKAFQTASSRDKKLVRYILCALEYCRTKRTCDFENPRFAIEHIFPENPTEGWASKHTSRLLTMTCRLGNMTLLEDSIHHSLGNETFDTKRSAYRQSIFQITRDVGSDTPEWTPDAIERRQQHLAEMAVHIWKLPSSR